jgi:hypothetical protein
MLEKSLYLFPISRSTQADQAATQAHAIVVSVTYTAWKRNQDVLAILQNFIGQPAPTSS